MPHHSEVHKTKNPLAVYAPNPEGVCFDTQEKGENIVLLLRQHLITQVVPLLEIVALFVTPFVIGPILIFLRVDVLESLSAIQVFWVLTFWYLFTFGFAFYKFIHWYFNVYLLTNERVVDVDYRGILHIETAYANLNQIQDVSPKIIGFFGTFFHFGNVYLQTAGEKQEFEFHHVEKPDAIAKKILEEVRLEAGEPPGVVK